MPRLSLARAACPRLQQSSPGFAGSCSACKGSLAVARPGGTLLGGCALIMFVKPRRVLTPTPRSVNGGALACSCGLPLHVHATMAVTCVSASGTPVPWTRPCAGLWWCRRRLLVGGPCAYVPESIRHCYALWGPPPVVLGWGGHCANNVMCSHGEVGLRRGLFTTELRKPARRSCLARAQGPAQGPSAILVGRWA